MSWPCWARAQALHRNTTLTSSLRSRILSAVPASPSATTCLPLGQGQRCAYLSSQPRRLVSKQPEAHACPARGGGRVDGRKGVWVPGAGGAITPTPAWPSSWVSCGFTVTHPPTPSPATVHKHLDPDHTGVFPVHETTAVRSRTSRWAALPCFQVWLPGAKFQQPGAMRPSPNKL